MFGTALLVLGTSLLDSVERSMQKTVTESLAGHLQVYSADAENKLALFGDVLFGGDDIGEIENFATIREPIEALENVAAVVPMGITQARFVMGNRIDEVIAELRDAVDAGNWGEVDALGEQIREMAENLKSENIARSKIASDPAIYQARIDALNRVLSNEFWEQDLRNSPAESLLFLDTDMAPLASDGRLVFMRVMGTDPQKFAEYFDRFRIVEGQMIPRGRHGLLVSHRAYDQWLKNQVAHGLDELYEEIHEEDRSIADDELLQNDVERLADQYRQVTFGLPPENIAKIKQLLRVFLDSNSDDTEELVREFLSVTDANFDRRYEFFYDKIAPLMRMYEFEVGEVITLQAFTERGFPQSANVKVWGTFEFQGMEDSDMAGSVNIIDLPTFRTLYGVMSPEARAELKKIRETVGVEDVRRDEAEAALFGGGDPLVTQKKPADEIGVVESAPVDDAPIENEPTPADSRNNEPIKIAYNQTYDPAQLTRGLIRNAAVILEDPTRLGETKAAIEELNAAEDLGLNVLDWQEAAGIVGQFVIVIRLVLYVAIGIIFLVALVIINNSMVMATVERTNEIGTMRAIGAQRWYVMALFLLETLILGLAAGLVGCALGAGTILVLNSWGIPATTNFLHFLFAGDRLYPTLSADNMLVGLLAILLVSLLSTLYPARLATRIQPIVAMRQ
jgi:ABC-type lipoprotein release transport system permease subunit